MNKIFCDRCEIEIKKGKEEQFRLIQLWTFEENKENDFWELCKNCTDLVLKLVKGDNNKK